jgi:tetratricopeptide (TPR) repeat protein
MAPRVTGSLALLVGSALVMAVLPTGASLASAAPRPVEEKTSSKTQETKSGEKAPIPKTLPELRLPPPPGAAPAPTTNDVYRALLRQYPGGNSPADTLGNGVYALARSAFFAGRFEEAMARAAEFTRTYTRNLNLNDALEMTLLIRGFRDFEDQPLKAYGRVLALRGAGQADSAFAAGRNALARWPGARIRHHLHFQLAEMARDRGDHATAVTHALAVADPSSKSRLAPAALKLAGDESVAAGQGQDRALRIYQDLLERYPDSPLAPSVRAQVLEMRKRLQL